MLSIQNLQAITLEKKINEQGKHSQLAICLPLKKEKVTISKI